MIPYLKTIIAEATSLETQRAIVREYLQMRILQSLQSAGAMIPLAFHGGTALRLLYHLPRYSEDLDFALERHREQYDFRKYLATIQRDMTAETYDVEIKLNERNIVHSAFIRFRGLYHQLDLSPHQTEILAIKLEIDTNPPASAVLDTTLVQHHVTVHLQHHDQASVLKELPKYPRVRTSGTLFLLHRPAPASSPQACTIARPSSPAERAVPNCIKLRAAL